MAIDYFGLAGTNDLAGNFTMDPYGGNGVSLAEAADAANGPYDYQGASGGILFARDQVEADRMAAGYPLNGQSWDVNAASLGISRLIDSAARYRYVASGGTPATYAGQNGLTYANGRLGVNLGGNMLPMIVLGFAAIFILSSK